MKKWAVFFTLWGAFPLWANEVSFYWLNNMAVQYEGTGWRERPAGWELKVKPQSTGQGIRWRHGMFQLQGWRNTPYFSWEDGNSDGSGGRQTGQTRLSVHAVQLDLRLPLAGTALEAVGGVLAAGASLDRKDVFFNGISDPGEREKLSAAGPVVGFHMAAERPAGRWALWVDGEAATVRYVWSRNRLKMGGGSISRGGFAYLFRAEAGVRRGGWRWGVGLLRQMHEILVPGGRGLSNGAAASLPINKIDMDTTFVSVARELP